MAEIMPQAVSNERLARRLTGRGVGLVFGLVEARVALLISV